MGYTLAQAAVGSQNASAITARTNTFGSSTTSGNLLVVLALTNGSADPTLSIADTIGGSASGNTWQVAGTFFGVAGDHTRLYIWFCPNASGGATHAVTLTPSSAGWISFAIMECAGGATSSTQDGSAATAGPLSTTTPATGSLTIGQANDLVVGLLTHNGGATTLTPGTNYTQAYENEAATNMPINVEYDLDVDANQAADWTMGVGRAGTYLIAAAFKEATAGTDTYFQMVAYSIPPRTAPQILPY